MKVFEIIETKANDVIEIQRELVSVPAVGPENGGTGEYNKSVCVRDILEKIGFDEITEYDAPDDRVPSKKRPNIVARLFGIDQTKTVWILTHMDVVPAGDLKAWDSEPFSLEVDGDKLIGRGTEDNHQGLVAGLIAVKALKEAGETPPHNIGIAVVADEETGNKYGLEYLLNNHRQVFGENDLYIVPDAGDPEGLTIEVAEKHILWLRFEVKGRTCHASTPDFGNNAHRAGAHLLVAIDRLNDIFNQENPLFDPPRSTFEPTKKEANVLNVNSIPGEDIFYFDCRILPEISPDDVLAEVNSIVTDIQNRFGVKVNISFPQRNEATPPTPADAPVVKLLQKAVKKVKRKEGRIVGIGGGTIATLLRRAGLPAVVWGTIDDTAHQPNEYSRISATLDDAKVFAYSFLQDQSG